MRARVLAGLVGLLAVAAGRAADRPNILWLVTEDHAPRFVGAYGDPLARTPNLDRLAAGGIVVEHAHSVYPVCAPTRHAIITGRYPYAHGAQHMRGTPALPAGVRFFPEYLRAAGYFCTNNAKTDYNTATPPDAAWDENGRQAHWRHRRPGQPFFAVFNFEQTHESRLHRREPLVTDPARVRVPAWLPDTPTVRADLAQYYDCAARADEALGRVLAELAADGLADDTIIIHYSDNGGSLPRTKRFLQGDGTRVAMTMHFPEKYRHLAPPAVDGRLAELVNSVDLAPTVLSLAGVPLPAQFQGRAFAGPARAAAPAHAFVARDRMDERYEFSRAVTDGRFLYIRNYQPGSPWGQHLEYLWRQASMAEWAQLHRQGRLTGAPAAFFAPKPAEELYDSETDPDHVHNIAADPTRAAVRDRLRAALRAHQLAVLDTGFLPEALVLAVPDGSSPATLARAPAEYPLAGLLDLADALQLGGRSADTDHRAALHDPRPVVRYWAAAAAPATTPEQELAPLLADSDRSVRLAAAEALLRRRDDPAAWRVLTDAVQTGTGADQLLALNIAGRVRQPLPAGWRELLAPLAAIPVSTAGMDNYVGRAAASLLEP
jgi:N-sulfoglucosamine sulfohydrolase